VDPAVTDGEENPVEDAALRDLLEGVFRTYHHDFRGYAWPSLRRRAQAARIKMGVSSFAKLGDRVLSDRGAFTELLAYLTVQVSEMFRDPPFFRAFREQVVPVLETYPSLRIWIAGCGAGEELYSYAILLREASLLERCTIYATDVSLSALERAKDGIYDAERLPGFTANYHAAGGNESFARYYTAGYGAVRFDRSLVRDVVFADHSLATDQVFAEVHVVSCRNVLIYFDGELQDRTTRLFRDSLIRRGFLGLGSKESLDFCSVRPDFEEFAPAERWYRRC
jgi:chemotaxis protein methyltransferase CheR